MAFNPNEHLMKLGYGDKAQDYLQVMWRLVWFREMYPEGTIDTEEIVVDLDREIEALVDGPWNPEKRRKEKIVKRAKGYARFKAVVTDGKGGRATGTKSENAASFDDFIEKAETGAIGRALAGLGFGTQFTGDEFNESHRIVDSPVERAEGQQDPPQAAQRGASQPRQSAPIKQPAPVASQPRNELHNVGRQLIPAVKPTSTTQPAAEDGAASEQQVASIRKLCERLGKAEPEGVASLSNLAARTLIQALTVEYREQRRPGAATDTAVRRDLLNAIYDAGVAKDLWRTGSAMAVYITKCLGRTVLQSQVPDLSNDDIAKVKQAVESAQSVAAVSA